MVYMSNTGKKHDSGWEEGDWSWRNVGVNLVGEVRTESIWAHEEVGRILLPLNGKMGTGRRHGFGEFSLTICHSFFILPVTF